jgi:hypothetical protein
LLEHAKTLPPDKVGRHGSTHNRHLTQPKSVIEYIETSGKSVGDYTGVQKLRAKVVTRARDVRAILEFSLVKKRTKNCYIAFGALVDAEQWRSLINRARLFSVYPREPTHDD